MSEHLQKAGAQLEDELDRICAKASGSFYGALRAEWIGIPDKPGPWILGLGQVDC